VRASLQAVLNTGLLAATAHLVTAGVTVTSSAVMIDYAPAAPWLDRQLAFGIPLEQWPATWEAIRNWSDEDRAEAGIRCRIVLVPVEDSEILPMGISFHNFGKPLPLLEQHLGAVADALGIPLRTNNTQAEIQEPIERLRSYSYALVRRANRTPGWASDPVNLTSPESIGDTFASAHAEIFTHEQNVESLSVSDQCRLVAFVALRELCSMVGEEDGKKPGLAAGLSSIDVTHPMIPDGYAATAKLNFALTAAIEADRGSQRPT
jgi:hypothetical protein